MATFRSCIARGGLRPDSLSLHTFYRQFSVTPLAPSQFESKLPRVAQPSLWASLVPKAFRKSKRDSKEAARRAAERAAGASERRVGITFLFLGIIVGSNAIHLINVKREMLNFTRETEAKLAALREVIKRVKNGEEVDVKKVLGTGDADQEKEWEQVIKELETTDMLAEGRKKREAERKEKAERRKREDEERRHSARTNSDGSSNEPSGSSGPRFLM